MTEIVVDELIKALCKVNNFKISYKKMYYYLNKSDFQQKIEEMETQINISPYTIFVNEQLNKNRDLNEIMPLWQKIRKHKKIYSKYQEKYNKLRRKIIS